MSTSQFGLSFASATCFSAIPQFTKPMFPHFGQHTFVGLTDRSVADSPSSLFHIKTENVALQ